MFIFFIWRQDSDKLILIWCTTFFLNQCLLYSLIFFFFFNFNVAPKGHCRWAEEMCFWFSPGLLNWIHLTGALLMLIHDSRMTDSWTQQKSPSFLRCRTNNTGHHFISVAGSADAETTWKKWHWIWASGDVGELDISTHRTEQQVFCTNV